MNAPLLLQAPSTSLGNPQLLGESFVIRTGDILWIQGPNGCGKSTLLKRIREGIPRKQSIWKQIFSRKLKPSPPASGSFETQLHDDEISYLPQGHNLSFSAPVTLEDVWNLAPAENASTLLFQDYRKTLKGPLSWKTASGGEKKKVLLMLTAARPQAKLLLLDEPSHHLDAAAKITLGRWIRSVTAQGGAALIVSHEAPDCFGLLPHEIHRTLNLARDLDPNLKPLATEGA